MTLKTTKEQREEIARVAAKGFWTGQKIILDLCHDADEAERLETEVIRLSGLLVNRDADTVYLRKEIADLRAKLRYYELEWDANKATSALKEQEKA